MMMMMKENASAVVAGRQGNFVPWTMLLFQILYILNSKETTKWWELTIRYTQLPSLFFCLSFESLFFLVIRCTNKKAIDSRGTTTRTFSFVNRGRGHCPNSKRSIECPTQIDTGGTLLHEWSYTSQQWFS